MNNNAYTNLMAQENLRYAARTVRSLRAAGRTDTTRWCAEQPRALRGGSLDPRGGEHVPVPSDERLQIVLQDDNFLDREPWDFRNTPRDRYPLLLFYHPLNIYRKQVIKQADVILAMFLLGDAFPLGKETKL